MGIKGDSLVGRSELMRMLKKQTRESAKESPSEKRKREREEKKIETEWRRKEKIMKERRKFKAGDKVIFTDPKTKKEHKGKILSLVPGGRYHFYATSGFGEYVTAKNLRRRRR